jgi:hypothetical protein
MREVLPPEPPLLGPPLDPGTPAPIVPFSSPAPAPLLSGTLLSPAL